MHSTIDVLPCLRSSSWSNGSIPGQDFLKKLLNPRLAKSSVKTGQRRVDPCAVYIFIRQRQNQTSNGQRAITGISEAEQRRKQYQAGVEVTSIGSEFQGKAAGARTRLRNVERKCAA